MFSSIRTVRIAGLAGPVRLTWLARSSSTISAGPDKGQPGGAVLKPGWPGKGRLRDQAGQAGWWSRN